MGSAQVDLRYQRVGEHTAVDVRAMRGDVRVAPVSEWGPAVPLGCIEPETGPIRRVA